MRSITAGMRPVGRARPLILPFSIYGTSLVWELSQQIHIQKGQNSL
ncbi:MAG: hypothetical protein KDE51_12950 [Anaerolineales bacterium]|nr:hypothetical protein [Anaerolineales bacterium]